MTNSFIKIIFNKKELQVQEQKRFSLIKRGNSKNYEAFFKSLDEENRDYITY